MTWPLVSWIMSSSSSSSSSDYLDEEEPPNDEAPNDVSYDPNDDDDDYDATADDSPSLQSPYQQPLSAAVTVAIPAIFDPSASSSKRRRTDEDAGAVQSLERRRIWTREDEIELLRGFLTYTSTETTRRMNKDHVVSFYDRVKPELQLRFNKSQIIDKLRRMKKKYLNNTATRRSSSSFKSLHEEAIFQISEKIWRRGKGEQNISDTIIDDSTSVRRKTRSQTNKSCNEGNDSRGLMMDLALNPMPLVFNGGLVKVGEGEVVDEKWREQQIAEMEVYLKRLEMVQEQVKAALEKLRSMGGG
ncbi:hypothetical protein UlMin_030095 [Ulmus minor]